MSPEFGGRVWSAARRRKAVSTPCLDVDRTNSCRNSCSFGNSDSIGHALHRWSVRSQDGDECRYIGQRPGRGPSFFCPRTCHWRVQREHSGSAPLDLRRLLTRLPLMAALNDSLSCTKCSWSKSNSAASSSSNSTMTLLFVPYPPFLPCPPPPPPPPRVPVLLTLAPVTGVG